MPGPSAAPSPERRALIGAAELRAALDAGEPVRGVVARRRALSPEGERAVEAAGSRDIPCRRVADRELARLLPPGRDAELLGMAGPDPRASLAEALRLPGAAWLLVGVAYPGNAGVVVRSAEVAGADAVAIDAAFDRRERRECLRASMRADRWLPVHFVGAAEVLHTARERGRRILAVESSAVGPEPAAPWELDLCGPVLFVLGGEQAGLPQPLLEAADAVLRIPMPGFVPSYNLQAAAAMVMGERLRQQAAGTGTKARRRASLDGGHGRDPG